MIYTLQEQLDRTGGDEFYIFREKNTDGAKYILKKLMKR